MKIAIMSDLHLEYEYRNPTIFDVEDADVVVLAGDIGVDCIGIFYAFDHYVAKGKRVVYVAGNHEFYGSNYNQEYLRGAASAHNIDYLYNSKVVIGDVTFVGGTLWTDYNLYNDVENAKNYASLAMSDFTQIKGFTPEDAERECKNTVEYLAGYAIEKLPEHKTVVVTHHLPSAKSINPIYAGNLLNSSFASDLDWLVKTINPKLWIHGHTHFAFDYDIGETRVICNPRGYPRERARYAPVIVEI